MMERRSTSRGSRGRTCDMAGQQLNCLTTSYISGPPARWFLGSNNQRIPVASRGVTFRKIGVLSLVRGQDCQVVVVPCRQYGGCIV
jgi:hypothetical protein